MADVTLYIPEDSSLRSRCYHACTPVKLFSHLQMTYLLNGFLNQLSPGWIWYNKVVLNLPKSTTLYYSSSGCSDTPNHKIVSSLPQNCNFTIFIDCKYLLFSSRGIATNMLRNTCVVLQGRLGEAMPSSKAHPIQP